MKPPRRQFLHLAAESAALLSYSSDIGVEPMPLTSAESAKFIADETDK